MHILLFKALDVEHNNNNDKSFLFRYATVPSYHVIRCSGRLQTSEMVLGHMLCPF